MKNNEPVIQKAEFILRYSCSAEQNAFALATEISSRNFSTAEINEAGMSKSHLIVYWKQYKERNSKWLILTIVFGIVGQAENAYPFL